MHVYMCYVNTVYKIQILFPDPVMKRVKQLSKRLDMPVSEIVRRATETWIEKHPSAPATNGKLKVPTVSCGNSLIDASDMRDAAYE